MTDHARRPAPRTGRAKDDTLDTLLEAFGAISLDEMDGVTLMNRVDTKYALSEAALQDALDGLTDRYRVLDVDGLRRSPYTTLYFDTPTLQCYHEHHNGKANRRKYRIRSYASSGATFFEVKTKTNKGRTIKKRVPIGAIDEALGPESTAMVESITGAPVPLSAKIWTTFRRTTLVGRDAAERVTIDTNLCFTHGDRHESLVGLAIAEVKQERASRNSAIRRMLKGLQIRPARVSKYCLGSILLDPSLKQNAFKSTLLDLHNSAAHRMRR